MGKDAEHERRERSDTESIAGEGTCVRCGACRHGLTFDRARLEVEGKHTHTFVNPGGEKFTIRCYREASGCRGFGEESTFWSWFRGFAWQVALCGQCGAHVGWFYRGDAASFVGLIADRVIE
jgi:uncharacterized protein (DUF983 family)